MARPRALARQNRVTPFGDLIVTPERGTLMGNRGGCLHDAAQRIVRPFAGRRWIVCVLEFKGRRRRVMTPGRYTELFFLDEATAFAAGHRPCAECQRSRYNVFREHWAAANPDLAAAARPAADDMDHVLHAERLGPGRTKRTYRDRLARLPVGVMVADEHGRAFLVHERGLLRWTPGGYAARERRAVDAEVSVLTPRSVVRAIARGMPVDLHPSALSA
jgi:hypothetical protein